MTSVSSPCVKLCVVDAASGLCEGCGRTLAEIGRWSAMSEAERRAVMGGLPERLRGLAAHGANPTEATRTDPCRT